MSYIESCQLILTAIGIQSERLFGRIVRIVLQPVWLSSPLLPFHWDAKYTNMFAFTSYRCWWGFHCLSFKTSFSIIYISNSYICYYVHAHCRIKRSVYFYRTSFKLMSEKRNYVVSPTYLGDWGSTNNSINGTWYLSYKAVH